MTNTPNASIRRRRPRPTFHTVQVCRVEHLAPHTVSVIFGGEELKNYTVPGPATHIKIFFPEPGQERPVLPNWGPDGWELLPGQNPPTSRTYTPRRFDPEALELEVQFTTKTDGPGAKWVNNTKVGDTVIVTGARRPYEPNPDSTNLLIAGDESALPAIATIVESLKEGMHARVLIEVLNSKEEQAFTTRANVNITWLHRETSGQVMPGSLLEQSLLALDPPLDFDGVWIACEAGIMRNIRRHLLYACNLPRELLVTRGYWKVDTANHPDHDFGEDV